MRENLQGEETDEVSKVGKETKDGPIVGPKAECLLVGVVLEGLVRLSEGDEDYYSVVDEKSEVFLHLFFSF
jgi:hypothetical protein